MTGRITRILLVLISLVLLTACGLPLNNGPATSIPGLANTLAVQTMNAQPGLAAILYTSTPQPIPASPTSTRELTPSDTPVPTLTPAPFITVALPEIPTEQPIQPVIGSDGEEIPCNAAIFVKDVTVPDDSIIRPKTVFTKTWLIKNVGACTWTPDYSAVFVWGADMDGTSPTPLSTMVLPNETAEISVKMKAPDSGNCYQGNWMLEDPDGNRFGVGYKASEFFWIAVTVWAPGMSKFVR